MKLAWVLMRSVNAGLPRQFKGSWTVRTLSTSPTSGNAIDENNNSSSNYVESADDFEWRMFRGVSENSPNTDSFYKKLDIFEKGRGRSGFGSKLNEGNGSQFLDGLDESFNTLSDGMDGRLKKAATYFEFNPDEIDTDDYSFRPDMTFKVGMTYTTKDLDLTKPGVRKPFKRPEFEVTTKEVLRKADFRIGQQLVVEGEDRFVYEPTSLTWQNVRFLANFITEAGIIIKRSKTRISAKAQRKVAREIKTARAFGLMPFTTMGTKPFIFGKTMEDLDDDDKFDGSFSNA